MNIKNNFVKITAATALTLTGVAAVNVVKPDLTANVQAATTRIKINYVPGYGVNIWTNYQHPHFTGQRAAHGSVYNVIAKKTDAKGQVWYQIGDNQWIMGQYAINLGKKMSPVVTNRARNTINNPRQTVNRNNNNNLNKANFNSNIKRNVKNIKKNVNQINNSKPVTPTVRRVRRGRKSVQASGNAAAIIALAKSELGKPYAWGATGANSFDCSGLTSYVYAHAAGVRLGRTTYAQVKEGTRVSLRNLQPGDLLFWGSASAPYHVGIYIGNNQYIHAATPRQGVVKQTLSSYFYPSVAKRILN